MIENENFYFLTNVSVDTYMTKSEATACLSKKGASAIGKNKMAFQEAYVSTYDFLQLAITGHAFCNLFQFNPDQEYWLEKSTGKFYKDTPIYQSGANKGAMKLSFKADKFFRGAQTVFVDVDFTRFTNVKDYLSTLTYPPTCVYMSFSDRKKKGGIESRRFRMVYVFERILDKHEFVYISRVLTNWIERDTQEEMDDDCGTRMSQYMNGVYGNMETYSSNFIYSTTDFPPIVEVDDEVDENLEETTQFNEKMLRDMESMDYDTFMHYYSRQYRYFYRSEKPVWKLDAYQLTDKNYLQLWWYREKIQDGNHRRRKLYKNACIRRLICPDVDANTLLFNMYVDLVRFVDFSDKIITLQTLKRKVINCMNKSMEELAEYCFYEIQYWEENRPLFILKPGLGSIANINTIGKLVRMDYLDQNYDITRSVKANYTLLEGRFSEDTLYRYCHNRGICTNPEHVETEASRRLQRKSAKEEKVQRFIALYNPTYSLRDNQALLANNGIELSLRTISTWNAKYIVKDRVDSFSEGLTNQGNTQISPFAFPQFRSNWYEEENEIFTYPSDTTEPFDFKFSWDAPDFDWNLS